MLLLPTVIWDPYFLGWASAWRILIESQSASSSSATIMGSAVRTPCPISTLATQIETVPPGSICTNALGWKGSLEAKARPSTA